MYFLPFFFITDLLLNMTTGYFSKGELITEHIEICLNYARNMLFPDLLSIIPLIYNIYLGFDKENFDFMNYSLLLFFFRIKTIIKTVNKLEDTYSMRPKTLFFINLGKLLGFVIMMAHFFAAVWLFVAIREEQNSFGDSGYVKSWISTKKISGEDWLVQYLYAFYFACVSMTTIGFGDIVPVTHREMLLCIFLIFISCGVFGYNLNAIGQIF